MITVKDLSTNFVNALVSPVGFNGFNVKEADLKTICKGKDFEF